MAPRRPGLITTLAILNIVFGCLFLLCDLGETLPPTLRGPGRNPDQEFKEFMNHEMPGYTTYLTVLTVTSLALSVCYIVSGIGMLQLGRWGRILGLVCAGLGILHQVAVCIVELLAIQASSRFLPHLDPFFVVFGNFSRIFVGEVKLVRGLGAVGYNVLLLISLLLDSSVRAFNRTQREADRVDEEEDDWDGRREARRRALWDQAAEDLYGNRGPIYDGDSPGRRPARHEPHAREPEDDEEGGDPHYRRGPRER